LRREPRSCQPTFASRSTCTVVPISAQSRRAGEHLQRGGDARVRPRATVGELRPIGHLLRQRVLERVHRLRIDRLLHEKLAAHESRQVRAEVATRIVHDATEERLGNLAADHGRGLQNVLSALRQPIDACREHTLHRGGNRHVAGAVLEPIRTGGPGDVADLHERMDQLLDEERVASGARAELALQRTQRRIAAEQRVQQLGHGLPAERAERNLLVVRPPHPLRLVLGAEVQEKERAGGREGGVKRAMNASLAGSTQCRSSIRTRAGSRAPRARVTSAVKAISWC